MIEEGRKQKEEKDKKAGQAEEQQKFQNFFVRGFGKVPAVAWWRQLMIRHILKKCREPKRQEKNNNTQT